MGLLNSCGVSRWQTALFLSSHLCGCVSALSGYGVDVGKVSEHTHEILLSRAGFSCAWHFHGSFHGNERAVGAVAGAERWPAGRNVEILWEADVCWNRAQIMSQAPDVHGRRLVRYFEDGSLYFEDLDSAAVGADGASGQSPRLKRHHLTHPGIPSIVIPSIRRVWSLYTYRAVVF